MGEFELIRNFFAAAPCAQGGEGALGIGDDCALLAVPRGAVGDFHRYAGGRCAFRRPCDPFLLGQRSLAVAVSDLAAMGATPPLPLP
jgi:thiamine-monophosphate kinase